MPRYRAAAFLTCLLWLTAAHAEDVYVAVPWKDEQIQIRARLFHPAGPGRFPGVILLHHCGGLNADSPTMADRPISGRGVQVIIAYDSVAAQDSHARVRAFFAEHLT